MARQLGAQQYGLLREALRRYTRFHQGEGLGLAWTGLGTATDYAPVVTGGYMALADHRPNPGYACWWHLTPKGESIVQAWLDKGEDYHTVEGR